MVSLLSKHPDLKIVTESDFKLAFTNSWFDYAKTLMDLIPVDFLKSFITPENFYVEINVYKS